MPRNRSRLTIEQILAWADEYHRQHGSWPHMTAGPIEGTTESWAGVNFALYRGRRGLTGKSSLAELLREHRGVVVRQNALDEETILRWATAHYGQTGKWPSTKSGAVQGVQGETWNAIHEALVTGRRGLPGGSSLAEVLASHGVDRKADKRLRLTEILKWADSFFREHGHWPYADSGRVAESPKDTWLAIDAALRVGSRGLKGQSSLPRLLNKHRGILRGRKQRYRSSKRRLDMDTIMEWARAHRRRTGEWPKWDSGTIPASNGITWRIVDSALRGGSRGLPGRSSLTKLFGDRRTLRRNGESSPAGR